MPIYQAQTSFSLGLQSGERVPLHAGDLLPRAFVTVLPPHQGAYFANPARRRDRGDCRGGIRVRPVGHALARRRVL